jgi:DNA-binding response OmpR family regulator
MTTRILVVDDEPLICQLLNYQLGGAGYDVLTVNNGRTALEQLPLFQPDLVLLDVMMPGFSGWDVCRMIREYSSVPIVLLTGKSSDHDIITGLNEGADDYIAKPFNLPQLLARIEAVLRRSRQEKTPPLRSNSRRASETPPAPPVSPRQPPAAPTANSVSAPHLGQLLNQHRRRRGLTLHQVEEATGVRWEFLQALEQEQFGFMTRVQLRQALFRYSSFLEVDLQPFLNSPHHPKPAGWMLPAAIVAVIALLVVLALGIQLII